MKHKIHRSGDTFEHLKRVRTLCDDGMLVQPNPKYLDGMLEMLGLSGANPAPTPERTSKDDHEGAAASGRPCTSASTARIVSTPRGSSPGT